MKTFRIFIIIALYLQCIHVYAGKPVPQNYNWEGDNSNRWELGANWDVAPGTLDPTEPQKYNIGSSAVRNCQIRAQTTINYDIDYIDIYSKVSLIISNKTVQIKEGIQIRGNGSLVLNNNARLETPELRLLDENSSITINGNSSLIVTGTIYIGKYAIDDDLNEITSGTDGTPTLILNSGSISCNNLRFDPETGDQASITIAGGTFSVLGNVIDDGMTTNISVENDAVLNIDGNVSFSDQNDVIYFKDNTTTTINGNVLFENSAAILSIDDNSSVSINGNFSMSSATSQLLIPDGELSFGGNWNLNASTNISGGYIRSNGSSVQEITNSSALTVYDFEMNNSAGLNINNDLIINNSFTFTDGILNTIGTAEVSFLDNATASGFDENKYINGKINKTGDDAFAFPLIIPIGITAPGNTADQFSAEYFSTSPENASYTRSAKALGIYRVSDLQYWMLNHTNIASTSPISVTMQWNINSLVADLPDLRVAKWSSTDSKWLDLGNESTTGDFNSGTITSIPISEFSPFTLASSTPDNPLPVEITCFTAVNTTNNTILLQWITASETNNDFFLVEKSYDLKTWNSIYKTNGAGNTTSTQSYETKDNEVYFGTCYYRLKQVDFDGAYSYSEIVTIHINNFTLGTFNMKAFPNPFDDQLVFTQQDALEVPCNIKIYTTDGTCIHNEEYCNLQNIVIPTIDFNPGIYTVYFTKGESVQTIKLLKQ